MRRRIWKCVITAQRQTHLQRQRSGIRHKHGPAVVEKAEKEDGMQAAGQAQQAHRPRRKRAGVDVEGHDHSLGCKVEAGKDDLHWVWE